MCSHLLLPSPLLRHLPLLFSSLLGLCGVDRLLCPGEFAGGGGGGGICFGSGISIGNPPRYALV
jgi:hypothetical protein